ncbi:hypothetical protein GALLR39Z86_06580 [Glycomyces algeriensis]|uniref:Uncharacterized protein n=1 Tax=Glycomyces algeriensis TaxID=256037 RepID=A0A9W6G5T5_9ACTN|nr:hypothetical protein GALLR39Z86_06580 [Glycomyces algeriensis]
MHPFVQLLYDLWKHSRAAGQQPVDNSAPAVDNFRCAVDNPVDFRWSEPVGNAVDSPVDNSPDSVDNPGDKPVDDSLRAASSAQVAKRVGRSPKRRPGDPALQGRAGRRGSAAWAPARAGSLSGPT